MRGNGTENETGSLLEDALRSVTRFVSRRPKTVLTFVLLLAGLCTAWTARNIEFKTDRADLIDPQATFHQRWLHYRESFGNKSDIVVVVEAPDPQTIKDVLDDLGTRMKAHPDLFRNVLYKVEPGRLREKGLQYLSPEQLETGLERISAYRPILQGKWELIRLESIYRRLGYQLKSRMEKNSSKDFQSLLKHADLLSTSLSRYLEGRNDFISPWPEVLPVDKKLRAEAKQVVYFLNDRGTMGFLEAFPVSDPDSFNGPSKSINRLRGLIDELSTEYPSAHIGMTGIPVLENDEMRKSQDDMFKASLISFLGVGFILILGFRGFRHPALALSMLAVGMAWSFGYTTGIVGHLNILSVSFAAILIGLGIDFAIHYLARYLELRHEGRLLRPALLETSGSVGTGIVATAVTTALAFFCATFTEFLGVAELGIIAGGGVLLCAVATFVVLPALVSLADRHVEPQKLPTPFQGSWLRLLILRRPWLVTFTSLIVIGYLGIHGVHLQDGRVESRVKYDSNLLNLQAEGLESVDIQKKIFQEAQNSLLFAVSMADTREEALALQDEFEKLPSVHHVETLASRLPEHPPKKTNLLVQAFQAELARLPSSLPQPETPDPARIGQSIELFYKVVRDNENSLAKRIAQTLNQFLDTFDQLSLEEQVQFLQEYQHRMRRALLGQFQALAAVSNPEPITLANLPSELTSRFVSSQGKWLVQIYPKDQIWDLEPLTRFVADVRTVDPDVTGTPLQNYEATRQIQDSYESAALYALAVICLVLLADSLSRSHALAALLAPLVVIVGAGLMLHSQGTQISIPFFVMAYVAMTAAIAAVLDFPSFRDTLLTLIPPLAGGLLMWGILGILQVDLNPANLIVLPLVLGIGVDDGVHVLHDFRMQKGRYRTSSSTMNAIVLTSLTSMIGFGSMMVAAHRGLYSLGLVLVVGVGSCLFVSLVPLPALLTLIDRRKKAQRKSKRNPVGESLSSENGDSQARIVSAA